MTQAFPAYTAVGEPDLLFNDGKTDRHPLRGLINHGPFSLRFGAPSIVRLAVLAPQGEMARIDTLLRELRQSVMPREAKNYYPEYPGFESLMRVPIADIDGNLRYELPSELDRLAERQDKIGLARAVLNEVIKLKTQLANFDVVLVYLPRSWSDCFEGETSICTTSSRPIVHPQEYQSRS